MSNSQETDVVGLNSSVKLPLFVMLFVTYNDTNNSDSIFTHICKGELKGSLFHCHGDVFLDCLIPCDFNYLHKGETTSKLEIGELHLGQIAKCDKTIVFLVSSLKSSNVKIILTLKQTPTVLCIFR